MKEVMEMVQAWERIQVENTPCALATVVNVEGSSYRGLGSRMLITEDGRWIGGISGGCLEGDALRKAKMAMFQGSPQRTVYDTSGTEGQQIGAGLGCNGRLEVLITSISTIPNRNPILALKGALQSRLPRVLLTVISSQNAEIRTGETFSILAGEELPAGLRDSAYAEELREALDKVLDSGRSQTLQFGESLELLAEYLAPPLKLMVFGGNYDVIPLLHLARELGWRTTVVASRNRTQMSSWEEADLYLQPGCEEMEIDAGTAVVLMAHDYETDKANLAAMLKTDAGYIGILGPRRRTERMFTEWKNEGKEVPEDVKLRIHGPAGLDIGADSPAEIALSILAEIKAVFANCQGSSLRERKEAIHAQRR